MPTLGFLKKKRTRDAHPDPSATSQPNSPVTPTSAKIFEGATSSHTPTQTTVSKTSIASSLATTINQDPASPHDSDHTPMNIHNLINPQTQVDGPAHSAPYLTPQQLQPYSSPQQHQQHVPQQQPPPADVIVAAPAAVLDTSVSPAIAASPAATPGPFQPCPANAPSLTSDPITAASSSIQSSAPQHQSDEQNPSTMQTASYSSSTPTQENQARVTKGKYSLQDFEILRTLGTGSFGRVHLVQSRHNSRFYAIKVLKKAQVVKMKQIEHTNDERRMLGEVKHPFLITLWGTFQDSKNLYMVMDFVEGGELFSLLRKSGVSCQNTILYHYGPGLKSIVSKLVLFPFS